MSTVQQTTSLPDPLATIRAIDADIERREAGPARTSLVGLRSRLVGELLGDAEIAMSAVSPDFVLTTLAPAAPASQMTATDLSAGLEQMAGLGESFLMWMDFDHLVVDGATVAGDGEINTLAPGGLAAAMYGIECDPESVQWLRTRIAFFIDFVDDRMVAETLFMDPGRVEHDAVEPASAPARSALRDALVPS